MSEVNDLARHPLSFAGIAPPYSDFDRASAVILPVPYDSTSEWHKGSRLAPQAIIAASDLLEFYDDELKKEPYKVGIHTLPFIQPDADSPQRTVEIISATIGRMLEASKFVLSLGGEHTISLGAIKAFNERHTDLCVIQLDAHADMRDEYDGMQICQATVMRRIYELFPVIQVGIRSLSLEEQQFIEKNDIPVFYHRVEPHDISRIQQLISNISKDIYLTIDVDVFDPSIMPAVGTPEPGGLLWHNVLDIIRTIALTNNVVGADVVELCPEEGPAACTYTVAKLIYKIIGYCINPASSLK